MCFRMLETSNWLVTKLLSHVTHNTRMHCHKRDWLMVVKRYSPLPPCNQAKETEHSRNSDSEVLYTRNAKKIKA